MCSINVEFITARTGNTIIGFHFHKHMHVYYLHPIRQATSIRFEALISIYIYYTQLHTPRVRVFSTSANKYLVAHVLMCGSSMCVCVCVWFDLNRIVFGVAQWLLPSSTMCDTFRSQSKHTTTLYMYHSLPAYYYCMNIHTVIYSNLFVG